MSVRQKAFLSDILRAEALQIFVLLVFILGLVKLVDRTDIRGEDEGVSPWRSHRDLMDLPI